MGTHPIFESDFDCLTDLKMDPVPMLLKEEETNGRSDSVKLKIVTVNHGTFEITEPLTTSVGEVKLRIGDILHKQGTFFEPSFQRLLLNGEELSRNEQLLGQINMIGHEATIHLHELQNHPDSDLPSAESTASRIRLENCLLLQKNFAACIEASQTNSDPGERQRPNALDDMIPAEPGTRHLGYLVRDMANSLRTWSFQLQHLSDQLIRDDPLPDKQSIEYKKTRRLIQNNMDAARYLAPQLRDLADFVIPLGDEPPRQLGCITK